MNAFREICVNTNVSDSISEIEEMPVGDLWGQRKICREGAGLREPTSLDLCQAKYLLALVKQYSLNLQLETGNVRLFLLDQYCAPLLANKFKTEGLIKVSKNGADFKGEPLQALRC